MANVVYNEYKENMIKGTASFPGAAGDFGVFLVTSAYSANETDTVALATASELTSAAFPNYVRKPLASVTVDKVTVAGTTTDDFFKVDAANCSFGTTVTLSAAGAVIFKKGASIQNTASIITFIDFSGTKSSENGEFTIVWNANGILNYKQGV